MLTRQRGVGVLKHIRSIESEPQCAPLRRHRELVAALQVDAFDFGSADVEVLLNDETTRGYRVSRQAEGGRLPDELAAEPRIGGVETLAEADAAGNDADHLVHFDIPPIDASGQRRDSLWGKHESG